MNLNEYQRLLKQIEKFLTSKRGQMAIGAAVLIIGSIIATAFAMIVGAMVLGETYDVASGLNMSSEANETIEGMYDIIWPSMRLLPIQILVLVGASIMAAVGLFLGLRGGGG